MDSRTAVTALKAAAEPTRLRILALLSRAELNVKDLTQVLAQSQPRISRHLRLLDEAGLIERYREGSWVYLRLADTTESAGLARRVLSALDPNDPVFRRDLERSTGIVAERDRSAEHYFEAHAARWDEIRALHVDETEVERVAIETIGDGAIDLMVDLGTGTGRILELFAGRYRRAIGIDSNQAMLAYARSRLEEAGIRHAQVRLGDLYNLSIEDAAADVVVMHQVLHFLAEPARAVAEAARILKPGGRLLAVDFAPHGHDRLRDDFAHVRLGIATDHLAAWAADAGLTLDAERRLAPVAGGEGALTVVVWTLRRPAAVSAIQGRSPSTLTATG